MLTQELSRVVISKGEKGGSAYGRTVEFYGHDVKLTLTVGADKVVTAVVAEEGFVNFRRTWVETKRCEFHTGGEGWQTCRKALGRRERVPGVEAARVLSFIG